MNMYLRSAATAAVAVAFTMGSALAQTFPSRPLRIVEGFNVGAGDATIRLVAAEMSKTLGQPVVVEAIVGASGALAANNVAKAPADGYSMLFLGLVVISDIFSKQPMDAEKNFDPISNLCIVPYMVAASKKPAVKSFQELVALAKKNPGKLSMGYPSANQWMMATALQESTGVSFNFIPYNSTAAVMTSTLAGDLDLAFSSVAGWATHSRSGAVNVMFVTTNTRLGVLPDTPTAAELGIKNMPPGSSVGLWAPKGTPQAVIQRLNAAAVAGVRHPEVVAKLRGEAILVEPDGSTPAGLIEANRNEYTFFSKAAKAIKLEPQ